MISMEVAVQTPSMGFDVKSRQSSSYWNVPTTPKALGKYFYSTPSSPVRTSEMRRDYFHESPTSNMSSIPKSKLSQMGEPNIEDDDFAFDICQKLATATLSADELFDDGVIRLLETPAQSPISEGMKIIQDAYSYGSQIPTETIIEKTERLKEQKRGRRRNPALKSSSSRRTVRSLSPDRVSWNEEQSSQNNTQQLTLISKSPFANAASSKGSKRWRLKDLLFRSASEGRRTEKESPRKCSTSYKKQESFKSSNPRSGTVSTQERHYTLNRAASGDMKKTTFLPYKKGILGGLLFNPTLLTHRF